jgi:hypothetical protein
LARERSPQRKRSEVPRRGWSTQKSGRGESHIHTLTVLKHVFCVGREVMKHVSGLQAVELRIGKSD